MARSAFKMKGYSYPGSSPAKKVTVKAKEGTRDWGALYSQAKKEGASEKTLASLLSKAKTQKSAKVYVESNPDSKRVQPYAEGSKTT